MKRKVLDEGRWDIGGGCYECRWSVYRAIFVIADEAHQETLVAAGMLLSRIAGFIRVRVFAHYFGLRSDAADAFYAAFKIPNFLQNLFGEGALSASFIPVYASLI